MKPKTFCAAALAAIPIVGGGFGYASPLPQATTLNDSYTAASIVRTHMGQEYNLDSSGILAGLSRVSGISKVWGFPIVSNATGVTLDQTNTHYTVLTGDWTILDRDDTYMVTQDSADNANLSLFTWAGGQWNQATGADFKQLAGAFPGADPGPSFGCSATLVNFNSYRYLVIGDPDPGPGGVAQVWMFDVSLTTPFTPFVQQVVSAPAICGTGSRFGAAVDAFKGSGPQGVAVGAPESDLVVFLAYQGGLFNTPPSLGYSTAEACPVTAAGTKFGHELRSHGGWVAAAYNSPSGVGQDWDLLRLVFNNATQRVTPPAGLEEIRPMVAYLPRNQPVAQMPEVTGIDTNQNLVLSVWNGTQWDSVLGPKLDGNDDIVVSAPGYAIPAGKLLVVGQPSSTNFNEQLDVVIVHQDTSPESHWLGHIQCPGQVNSTGMPGLLQGKGSPVLKQDRVTLEASQIAPGNWVAFLGGNVDLSSTPRPVSPFGAVCLGNPYHLYTTVPVTNDAGVASLPIDYLGACGALSVTTGATIFFQAVYSDGALRYTTNMIEFMVQ
ncbi:MAG: hypothetical protein R3F33_17230 [Planctomycetota bacterium]